MGVSQATQLNLLDMIFGASSSQSVFTGTASLYIGASTSTYVAATLTDATIIAAEPTSATGSYARVVVGNNVTNFPASATGTVTGTKKLHIAYSFAASTAAWSSGATALASFFFAAAAPTQTGTPLWFGALSPATDVVNGTGVTFTFAIDALQMTLTPA